MKVIDSSSLAKYVNKEGNWQEIEKELSEPGACTLEFAMLEIANSIWKRVLKNELSRQDAFRLHNEFLRAIFADSLITIVSAESDLLSDALELSIKGKITIYDSAFIVLARRNKCKLLTSDEKQSDASKKHYPNLRISYVK